VESYVVEKVMLKNVVKLKLPTSIGIRLMVNISKIMRYRKLVKEQKIQEAKTN